MSSLNASFNDMAVKRTQDFVIYVVETAPDVRGQISQNATDFVSGCSMPVNNQLSKTASVLQAGGRRLRGARYGMSDRQSGSDLDRALDRV